MFCTFNANENRVLGGVKMDIDEGFKILKKKELESRKMYLDLLTENARLKKEIERFEENTDFLQREALK